MRTEGSKPKTLLETEIAQTNKTFTHRKSSALSASYFYIKTTLELFGVLQDDKVVFGINRFRWWSIGLVGLANLDRGLSRTAEFQR